MRMKRPKPEPETKYKKRETPEARVKTNTLYDNVRLKRDGLPRCFVCNKRLHDLIALREMADDGGKYTDQYNSLQHKVSDKIVELPPQGGVKLYRHKEICEPGSPNYLRSKVGEGYFERNGLRKEEFYEESIHTAEAETVKNGDAF